MTTNFERYEARLAREDARKIRIEAHEVQPGTILIPFIGDSRFDVTDVENTPQGSTVLIDRYRDLRVEMDSANRVEILGHFNLDD